MFNRSVERRAARRCEEAPIATPEEQALEALGEIVLTLDADLRCTYANPRAAEFVERLQLPEHLLRRVLAGVPQVWESRTEAHTLEFRAWPSAGGITLLGLDITWRHSEQRFRALVDQSPLSTQVLTPDGWTLAVNRAWEELWGLTLDQIREYNVLHDPQLEERGVAQYLRRGFAGEATAIPAILYDPEAVLPQPRTRENPARWVTGFIYPIKDERGTIREVVLVHQDITLQRRAEDELRDVARRLDLALAASRAGDWRWDAPTDLVILSARAAEIFGIPQGPHMTWTAMQGLLHPEDAARAAAAVETAVTTHGDYDIEYRVRIPEGGWRWVLARGRAEYDGSGGIVCMRGLVQDVSEPKRLEEELQRKIEELAEADRRKNEFLAMLGHELRNPLAPIMHAVEVLRLRPASVEWARDLISRQVGHLTRLVDDLLEVSRITRGQIQLVRSQVDLAEVVRRAVEGSAHRQELHLHLGDRPLWVDADAVRLAQIVGNLVHNAFKYTPDDGRIEISASAEGAQAVLAVQDTGVGIPPDQLPKVFDMFFQADRSLDRSQGGLGIGLTLVKRLVELHGGEVHAASEGLDRGSRFEVRLPLAAAGAAKEAAAPAEAGSGQLRILVVDDNQDAAESLQMVLEMQGHDVLVAHDGRKALEIASRERPDLVLLDIGLPGLDGYEVAARLRQDPATAEARLVALTGYGHEESRQRALAAGFDAHFAKPVAVGALLSGLTPPGMLSRDSGA